MLQWIEQNPVLFSVVVWPLVTAIVTAFFRKRTAEEYAAMPPRLAAFMRFVGAIGFDAPKALETVRLMVTGGVPSDAKPKPPPKPPVLPLMALVLALVFAAGCHPQESKAPARDTARAVVLLVAEGAKAADQLCAGYAARASNADLAKTCADGYDTVRSSLLAAEAGVDAWEQADKGAYLCMVGKGVAALASIADAVRQAGGPELPPVVVDALSLGRALSGGCKS